MQQPLESYTPHAYARTLCLTLAALFVQCMLCFLQTPTARCVSNTPPSPKLQHTPKSYAPIYVTLNTVSYRPCTLNYMLYTIYYVLYTMQIAKSYTAYGIQGLFHSLLACCVSSSSFTASALNKLSFPPPPPPPPPPDTHGEVRMQQGPTRRMRIQGLFHALVCDCACACARACACL